MDLAGSADAIGSGIFRATASRITGFLGYGA
jgi:hypothetical protein